jgi:hypothetical protein
MTGASAIGCGMERRRWMLHDAKHSANDYQQPIRVTKYGRKDVDYDGTVTTA